MKIEGRRRSTNVVDLRRVADSALRNATRYAGRSAGAFGPKILPYSVLRNTYKDPYSYINRKR
jgi:hypothetical protein